MPEFREFNKVFQLTSFFEEFENMFNHLERELLGEEMRIFIGKESPFENIREETVIFARYNLPDNCIGSLTLIGPTRMDYGKNIGLIKYTTEELNKLAKKT
ncbi:MAG: HrcA family transcriptional regulator [Candidatus Paceibacterota bacterium]